MKEFNVDSNEITCEKFYEAHKARLLKNIFKEREDSIFMPHNTDFLNKFQDFLFRYFEFRAYEVSGL